MVNCMCHLIFFYFIFFFFFCLSQLISLPYCLVWLSDCLSVYFGFCLFVFFIVRFYTLVIPFCFVCLFIYVKALKLRNVYVCVCLAVFMFTYTGIYTKYIVLRFVLFLLDNGVWKNVANVVKFFIVFMRNFMITLC